MLSGLKGMWERLKAHHVSVSPDFGWLYAGRDFAWRMEKWLRLGAGGVWACVAASEGAEAGFCVCLLDGSGGGEVATIYVDDAHRRLGIGAALMRRGLSWLAANGAAGVTLEVVAGNEGALEFYRSLGFKPRTQRLWLPPENPGPEDGTS